MKLSTKIVHYFIRTFGIEEYIIQKSRSISTFKKLIPLNHEYPFGAMRSVFRDNVRFDLNISDYMQWHIWACIEDLSWSLPSIDTSPPTVIIDIGANVGSFALKTAQKYAEEKKNAMVIAFEPNPYIVQCFMANLKLNKHLVDRVQLEPIGLSMEANELLFEWDRRNSGGGRFVSEDVATEQTERIKVGSLDGYIEQEHIKNIGFIKIDVEGFEPLVLIGAMRTIRMYQPNLYIEVTPAWWKNNGFSVAEVLSPLENIGYAFFLEDYQLRLRPLSLDQIVAINSQFNLFMSCTRAT